MHNFVCKLVYVILFFAGVLEQAQQSEGNSNRRDSSGGSASAPAVTATPPPSPTHGQPHSASPPGSLLSCMLSSTGRGNSTGVVKLALEALCHLLSWAPLGPHVSPSLTSAVFYWIHAHHSVRHFVLISLAYMALLALLQLSYSLSLKVHASNTDTGLSVLAMAAINEIFYKKCVPNEWEDNLLLLCEQALALSNELINHMGNLSEEYVLYLLHVGQIIHQNNSFHFFFTPVAVL